MDPKFEVAIEVMQKGYEVLRVDALVKTVDDPILSGCERRGQDAVPKQLLPDPSGVVIFKENATFPYAEQNFAN